MSNITQYGHSTNLIGLPTAYIASRAFNENPKPLHIAGTRETASGLFEQLARKETRENCGRIFQDYMSVIFGFETEQRLREDRLGRCRFRNSYLKLIQDWCRDSNNAQGAVFKGYVIVKYGIFILSSRQKMSI